MNGPRLDDRTGRSGGGRTKSTAAPHYLTGSRRPSGRHFKSSMRLRTTPAVTSLCRGNAVTCWPHEHRHFSCLPRSLTLLQRLATGARTTARFGIGFMDASDQLGFRTHPELAMNAAPASDKAGCPDAVALGAYGWQAFGPAGHRTSPAAAHSPQWLPLCGGTRRTEQHRWPIGVHIGPPMAHRCSFAWRAAGCRRSPWRRGARESQVRGDGARESQVRGRDTPREPFGRCLRRLCGRSVFAGEGGNKVRGRAAAVEQLADMLAGAPQRFEGRDALQRLADGDI